MLNKSEREKFEQEAAEVEEAYRAVVATIPRERMKQMEYSNYLSEGMNKVLKELDDAGIVNYQYAANPEDKPGGEYFVYEHLDTDGYTVNRKVKKQEFVQHLSELRATHLPHAEEIRRKRLDMYGTSLHGD